MDKIIYLSLYKTICAQLHSENKQSNQELIYLKPIFKD